MIRPLCKCHGIEMRKQGMSNGKQRWCCKIRDYKHKQSESGKRASSKYQKSEKGKIAQKKWRQSPKGRASDYRKNNSIKGWIRKRKWELKGEKERINSDLADIHNQIKELEKIVSTKRS